MKNTVEVINDQKSKKTGWAGIFETLLRRFKNLAFIGAIVPIAALYALCLSVAFLPGAFIFSYVFELAQSFSFIQKSICYALAGGVSIMGFIFGLVLIVPIVNWPIKPFVKPYRGAWYSLETIPWMYHNALIYLVRYTVLNLITPSPVAIFFLKAMGMKIGNHVVINTGNISDACLIEIDDYATIGGSVYMIAHYGMKGYLIIDKLKIGRGANIGLHSYLMASEIGDFATVMPNATVLPKTKIPPQSKFGHTDSVISTKDNSEKKDESLPKA